MAIDNLNYYSSWIPAWQLTDKYSSQPWCLKSKNLDIFSSSKSVKATAWSTPTTADADVVKQDGKLVLKTDWKVYERENGVDTLFIDPSVNFPIYDVSYTWPSWTYAPAVRWTPQDMVAKYEWNEWESFVVYTDRSSLVYSKRKLIFNKSFTDISSHWTYEWLSNNGGFYKGYLFNKKENDTVSSANLYIQVDNVPFSKIPLRITAKEHSSNESTISLNSIECRHVDKLYYDAQLDWMRPNSWDYEYISFSWDITVDGWVEVEIPTTPTSSGYTIIALTFKWTQKPWWSYKWNYWELYIDINWWPTARHLMTHADGTLSDWDSNYYYSYLPLRERKLVDIWTYGYSSSYWMKGQTFQALYKWSSSWIEKGVWNRKLIYDFITDMWWENDPAMDVIWMIVWNEQVYMIWNLDWNGYIIPCDLTWGRGTPYIAYGCEFKWVANIDYLMYLVWKDRGISTLWVFNQQELVPVIWWRQEAQYNDIVWVDEQYKFDWKIINRRKNLILTTEDNRIFQYGQTYGGKGGTFIHELPENATITWLKANWNDLEVSYSITENGTTTNYIITYQDDTPIRNYNTEWNAVYPIVLGNHLLEKEESDLYASYILPSSSCKLEFWGMANHYHFWTFKTDWNTTPSAWSSWVIDGSDWNYRLEFVEKNDEYLTFKLIWELPVMTWDETGRLAKYLAIWSQTYIGYSDFNHFRKIWEITTTEYQEWEFRFHNLNNKLDLPKSHSLQIMVKGKGTANHTPELFSVDLVANQRDRW